jgi:hypothetical protein
MNYIRAAGIAAIVIAGGAIYSLDHGLYVGTALYAQRPAPCCPEEPTILTRQCKYLFVTGIAEIPANDGRTKITEAEFAASRMLGEEHPPAKGYCTLFAK